ncbi:L-seryl-tRNA(Sec) kinase [Sabethes cyaneus]|uniref:L-seryl-tRNA(Sec) kinase n=1 Tax=Sabethes cyaneus TaxID=53552 RepID=UPI00221E352C|nr:L-seryl-tRNA(Sec) kinase [Sabethes cyaneus]
MSNVCINVLVGLPGVGKTTFCNEFQQYLLQKGSPIVLVKLTFDEFININSKQDLASGLYKTQRKQLLECIEMLVSAVRKRDSEAVHETNENLIKLFKTGVSVDMTVASPTAAYLFVLDDNMYYRSMRYEVLKIARKYNTGYFQTFFDVPVAVAIVRNAERSKPIPQDIILRMAIRLEKPNARFYRWETSCIFTNDPLNDFVKLEAAVIQYVNNPEKFLDGATSTQPVEQTIIHKLDLVLRRIVGDVIQSSRTLVTTEELKLLVEELNHKRKAILSDARNGLIEIDMDKPNQEHIRKLFEFNR